MEKGQPWAAVRVESDDRISVYVHNWIRAGIATNPQELWDLVLSGWHNPGKFWDLFYQEMGKRASDALEPRAVDPKLKNLSIDDLGI